MSTTQGTLNQTHANWQTSMSNSVLIPYNKVPQYQLATVLVSAYLRIVTFMTFFLLWQIANFLETFYIWREANIKVIYNIYVPVKHAFKVRIVHVLHRTTICHIYYNNIHAFSWNFFVAWTPWMGLTFDKTVHFAYNLYETVYHCLRVEIFFFFFLTLAWLRFPLL